MKFLGRIQELPSQLAGDLALLLWSSILKILCVGPLFLL